MIVAQGPFETRDFLHGFLAGARWAAQDLTLAGRYEIDGEFYALFEDPKASEADPLAARILAGGDSVEP